MRIGPRQLRRSMRVAVVLVACLMLWAMTSGLLLAIHIPSAGHASGHDTHDCSLCQQLLALSKKFTSNPGTELVCEIEACGLSRAAPIRYVPSHCLEARSARGPPSIAQQQFV